MYVTGHHKTSANYILLRTILKYLQIVHFISILLVYQLGVAQVFHDVAQLAAM